MGIEASKTCWNKSKGLSISFFNWQEQTSVTALVFPGQTIMRWSHVSKTTEKEANSRQWAWIRRMQRRRASGTTMISGQQHLWLLAKVRWVCVSIHPKYNTNVFSLQAQRLDLSKSGSSWDAAKDGTRIRTWRRTSTRWGRRAKQCQGEG